MKNLTEENYLLKTIRQDGKKIIVICGGDKTGVLYGAYRYVEHLGIRFYLHGGVIPDEIVK